MPSNAIAWTIPLLALMTGILLVTLQQHLTSPQPAPSERGQKAVIEAVRMAPADPFRYGGRTVGNILDQIEPLPGWTDLGWEVHPHASNGYWILRRYQGPSGAERVYRFAVGPSLNSVTPANDRARQLMDRGPA